MDNPRRGRVVEQHFLNLPGFQAGAYVRAYVEDTTSRHFIAGGKGNSGKIPYPTLTLEIADCIRRIDLEFYISTPEERMNSFHKIDTLIAALEAFRDGMADEAALYRRRVRAVADAEPSSSARG